MHSGCSDLLRIERDRHGLFIKRHTAFCQVHRAVDQNPVCPDAFGVQQCIAIGPAQLIEQTGIPEAIPLEMCYLGWQESLAQLATLVEPDIPG